MKRINTATICTSLFCAATMTACAADEFGDETGYDDFEAESMNDSADELDLEFRAGSSPLGAIASGVFSYIARTGADFTLARVIKDFFPGATQTVELSEASLQAIANIVGNQLDTKFSQRDHSLAESVVDKGRKYVRSVVDPAASRLQANNRIDDAIDMTNYLDDYGLNATQVYQAMSSLKLSFMKEVRAIAEIQNEPISVLAQLEDNVCDAASGDLTTLAGLEDELVNFIEGRFSKVRLEVRGYSGPYGGFSRYACYDGPTGKFCTHQSSYCDAKDRYSVSTADCSGASASELLMIAVSRRDSEYAKYVTDTRKSVLGEEFCDNMADLVTLANACGDAPVAFACHQHALPRNVMPDWRVVGSGDVTGDGNDDIVWQHESGQVRYWSIVDGKLTDLSNLAPVEYGEWDARAVGDIDGNGVADIIFQRDDGQVFYWPMMHGGRSYFIATNIHSPVASDWKLRGSGDINGDGTDDLIWRHEHSGHVHYWPMTGGMRQGGVDLSGHVPSDWHLKGSGDMNGDGQDDIVWQHDDGRVHYWPVVGGVKQTGVDIGSRLDYTWTMETVIDADADGTTDVLWRHEGASLHHWMIAGGKYVRTDPLY